MHLYRPSAGSRHFVSSYVCRAYLCDPLRLKAMPSDEAAGSRLRKPQAPVTPLLEPSKISPSKARRRRKQDNSKTLYEAAKTAEGLASQINGLTWLVNWHMQGIFAVICSPPGLCRVNLAAERTTKDEDKSPEKENDESAPRQPRTHRDKKAEEMEEKDERLPRTSKAEKGEDKEEEKEKDPDAVASAPRNPRTRKDETRKEVDNETASPDEDYCAALDMEMVMLRTDCSRTRAADALVECGQQVCKADKDKEEKDEKEEAEEEAEGSRARPPRAPDKGRQKTDESKTRLPHVLAEDKGEGENRKEVDNETSSPDEDYCAALDVELVMLQTDCTQTWAPEVKRSEADANKSPDEDYCAALDVEIVMLQTDCTRTRASEVEKTEAVANEASSPDEDYCAAHDIEIIMLQTDCTRTRAADKEKEDEQEKDLDAVESAPRQPRTRKAEKEKEEEGEKNALEVIGRNAHDCGVTEDVYPRASTPVVGEVSAENGLQGLTLARTHGWCAQHHSPPTPRGSKVVNAPQPPQAPEKDEEAEEKTKNGRSPRTSKVEEDHALKEKDREKAEENKNRGDAAESSPDGLESSENRYPDDIEDYDLLDSETTGCTGKGVSPKPPTEILDQEAKPDCATSKDDFWAMVEDRYEATAPRAWCGFEECWWYLDSQEKWQGPFNLFRLREWFLDGAIPLKLPMKCSSDGPVKALREMCPEWSLVEALNRELNRRIQNEKEKDPRKIVQSPPAMADMNIEELLHTRERLLVLEAKNRRDYGRASAEVDAGRDVDNDLDEQEKVSDRTQQRPDLSRMFLDHDLRFEVTRHELCECKHNCGFIGAFDVVSAHEQVCPKKDERVPRTSKTTKGPSRTPSVFHQGGIPLYSCERDEADIDEEEEDEKDKKKKRTKKEKKKRRR